MWEVISAIAGMISAICDLKGAGPSAASAALSPEHPSKSLPKKLRVFLLRTVAWCLGYACFLWIVQPYGVFISSRERSEMIGWFVVGPAFLVLLAAVKPSPQ